MTSAGSATLVYLVDDDDAFRDSLRWLLESSGYRVAAYPSAASFLENYRADSGACIVLDVRMPGTSGLELQQEIGRRGGAIPVIFVTGHGDVPMAVHAIKHGAFDFIEKPFKDDVLLALIEKATKSHAALRVEDAQRQSTAARLACLTQREREIMDRVVAGKRNKAIADELGISVKTVEIHRGRVMEKMQAESLAALVQMVMPQGSIPG
jgi:FixJ family two-component response regulator